MKHIKRTIEVFELGAVRVEVEGDTVPLQFAKPKLTWLSIRLENQLVLTADGRPTPFFWGTMPVVVPTPYTIGGVVVIE
jgi:hypothetical protein